MRYADGLTGLWQPAGELLRNRWGFQGYVYSDWGAIGMLDYFHHVARNKAEAAMLAQQAGLDAEASDNCFTELQQLWAFGHGLSYTEFEYLSAVTSKDDYGPDEVIDVEVKIRNTGGQDGMEVPQVYVRDVHASVVTPVHELKAFRKVMIRKGETATVRLSIPVSELALYDRNMKKVVEPGAFELQIGRALDDIRIKKVITVERHKETHIPTLADRKRKTAPAPVLVTAVKVRGVVRDVQANPLPDVAVSVGNRRVTTDAKGNYVVSALLTDTLIIGGGRYKEERIPIEGRQVIHVRLQNL